MKYIIAFILAATMAHNAFAEDDIRNPAVVAQFRKLNACPATGKIQRTCPGFVVDHMIPLCAGGPDTVDNMMWQAKLASYKKDIMERAICRKLSKCEPPKK